MQKQMQIKLTSKIFFLTSWSIIVLFLFIWSSIDYNTQTDEDLQREILLRSMIITSIITFPFCIITLPVVLLVLSFFTFNISGYIEIITIFMTCFFTGYLQYFYVLPKLINLLKK